MSRLKRNREGDFKIAKRTLSWIYWAKQSLHMRELQEAIAIVPIKDIASCDEESADLDPDSITDPEFIIDCCGSLILWDRGTDVVGFSHYTVSEFFMVNPDGNINSELYVARVCLTYLCFETFEDGMCGTPEKFLSRVEKYKLVPYIALYCGNHVSRSQAEKIVEDLVLSILWSAPRRQALFELYLNYGDGWRKYGPFPVGRYTASEPYCIYHGWAPLHFLSAWNLPSILDEILSTPSFDIIRRLSDISRKWSDGFSIGTSIRCGPDDLELEPERSEHLTPPAPLHVACHYGNDAVVALLLSKFSSDPNMTYGQVRNTPLYTAAERGQEGCVKLLVQGGAELRGGHFGDAMTVAAGENHGGIVKFLLENYPDLRARSAALTMAVGHSNLKLVKFLLDSGADADTYRDKPHLNHYENNLHAAACHGNEAIVELLLEAGADPNVAGGIYGTPLRAAASKGYERVVKILLKAGAYLEGHEITYRGVHGTALEAAATEGQDRIVQLLLEEGADVNHGGTGWLTPLRAAVHGGHEMTVKLLWEAGAYVNTQGGFQGTALSDAEVRGHKEIAKLLLEHWEHAPHMITSYGYY